MWEFVKTAEVSRVVAFVGLTSALLTAIVTFTAAFVKATLDERFERRKSKRSYLLSQLIPLHEYLLLRSGKAHALDRSFDRVSGVDETARDADRTALLNDWIATYRGDSFTFFLGLLPSVSSDEYVAFVMADQTSRTLAEMILNPWPARDLKYEEQLTRVLPAAAAKTAEAIKAGQDEVGQSLREELRKLQLSGAKTLRSIQETMF
jgi:hypothetical protein